MLEARLNRTLLLTVPVNTPDGRSAKLQIRQGEQHDLMGLVGDFVAAYRIADGFTYNLANEVRAQICL